MKFQEIHNTRLTLSLASSDDEDVHANVRHHHQENKRSKPNSQMIWHTYLPSCSLGSFPMELQLEYGKDNNNPRSDVMTNDQASPTDSSLSRFRSKREKEEVKIVPQEKPDSSRDEYLVLQDEEFGTRKKLKLTKDQSVILEDSFKEHTTLNSKQKHDLARRLNLHTRQVEVWFQNRRARTKLKETEVGHELLRNCFEALSNENKRLVKEVQELKTSTGNHTTLPPPFYKMAAPVITMCYFCERSYGGESVAYNSKQSSPVMYSSLLHQSALCETGIKSSSSSNCSSSCIALSLRTLTKN